MFENEYRIDKPRRGLRNVIVLIFVLVIAVLFVGSVYYLTKVNRAATDDSNETKFVVEKGMTTKEVAAMLHDQEIIGNKYIFLIYAKIHGAGNKIQAGEYLLNSNMTIPEIISDLTQGKVSSTDSTKVTIIEGKTNAQVAEILDQKNVLAKNDFIHATAIDSFDFKFNTTALKHNYQGFLFPDTYEFKKGITSVEVMQQMLTNFQSKITDKMISDLTARKVSLNDAIILASIIEKEVGRNKEKITVEDLQTMQLEREMVASVFYNRLEIGMALESDATVNYVTGKADRSVTIEDTKINSPYNTYRNRGLPPSPISNPGLGAIEAAINPADTDYLFFLNSPDGKAYFAKTLAEHNENRAKYLR